MFLPMRCWRSESKAKTPLFKEAVWLALVQGNTLRQEVCDRRSRGKNAATAARAARHLSAAA